MKRLSVILSMIMLVVGLGSCGKEKKEDPKVNPEPTALTLTPTAVTLQVGETKQLTATVEPADQTFTVTFASDKTGVATVDAQGLVKAVAEGTAKITATVGKLTKECVVTVANQGGGQDPVTTTNELPLIKFDPQYDQNSGKLIDPEILEHEAKIGRTVSNVDVGGGSYFEGFTNTDLTIAGVVYGLFFTQTKENVVIAYSKESVANCPDTKAMLAEIGFTNLEQQQDDSGMYISAVKDDDPMISLELFDSPNAALGTTLTIYIIQARSQEDLPIDHALIPDVQDFPDYNIFMSGDVAKIKEFEANLGFREYYAEGSDEAAKNLMFSVTSNTVAQTNFGGVYYISTPSSGPKFINSMVNFVKNSNDFADPKLKEWFTLNGYGNNYQSGADGAGGYDATGKVLAQVFISEAQDGTSTALLQIADMSGMQSATQMRRLAVEQYNLMLDRTMHSRRFQLVSQR